MRLLHTSTLEFQEFFSSDIPYYAILSHRWEEEEVSLQDLQNGKGFLMKGFAKIKKCCVQAASDGWQYVWIDTCCIDKTNSVELSEAINSMYKWYRDAEVCYVYMSDVLKDGRGDYAFARSRWFTRGWTLQEFLAPRLVIFFDYLWNEIGTKSSLGGSLSVITGIKDIADYERASVAQKMSWASRRETTREEDMAYCLMGLFGVHMAPLYGEGKNAFVRLQLEILSSSDDESIFAWTDQQQSLSQSTQGLLADSPRAFEKSSNVQELRFQPERPPYAMTNKGLRVEMYLIPDNDLADLMTTPEYIAPLNCMNGSKGQLVILKLVKINGDQYIRKRMTKLCNWEYSKTMKLDDEFFQSQRREVVYVKGRSHNQMLDPLAHFYSDLSVLFPTRFSISESYSSTPICCDWIINGQGSALLHDISEAVCFCGQHSGALMITDGGSIRFAVLIKFSSYKIDGSLILIPLPDQTLKDTVETLNKKAHVSDLKLCDRDSRRLEGKGSVSVALRWKGGPENRIYEAEITFDESGNLPWQDIV